jgi:NADP-reducing hydrogenase subunit HndD
MMIQLKINNIELSVPEKTTILNAARMNNINIPTLCYYPDLGLQSDCRICVVEIDGQKGLATSCSTKVREGMVVKTNSPRVLNARKTITELILSNHDANCTACPKNLKCELQSLANKLGIDQNRFEPVLRVKPIDTSNPSLIRNPNRCIKCGRCIDVCKNVQGMNVLELMGRGHDAEITPAYGRFLSDESCTYCGQCASVCPVGAIIENDETDRVWKQLHDKDKTTIVQVAPAVRVSLGEALGLPIGSIVTGKLVTALKLLGFHYVFDTDFTADLTIIEEGHELLHRVTNNGVLPMITSCCPGWINYAEQRYPSILSHISTCKSPQQMFGALAKTYFTKIIQKEPKDVIVVSIMPCTAKKYEAKRDEMKLDGIHQDVDIVLTTRELSKMLDQMGVDFAKLDETPFDNPFGITTGAAAIFGATGGVMEAALRTVYEVVNHQPLESIELTEVRGLDGIKETSVELGGNVYRFAVAHSLANAKTLVDQVSNGTSPYTFIEIMCCPGGCIGGGGQPYGTIQKTRRDRIEATYHLDQSMPLRKSHESPAVKEIYRAFLGEPLGELSHKLLHTHYHSRQHT